MDIAVFFAFFNIALGIVNIMASPAGFPELAALGGGVGQVGYNDTWAQDMQSGIQQQGRVLSNTTGQSGGIFGWFNAVWQGFFMILETILNLLGNITFGIQIMLQEFDMPWYIAWGVQAAVWIVYAWGLAQFLGGRSGKEAQ